MAPTIHLVRHAQGFHNLCVENEQFPDPDLTPLGEEQCAALRSAFPHHSRITRLIASPLRRTVYTCLNAFGTHALEPVLALPVFQEVSASPCDTGSPVAKVQAEFGARADFSRVDDSWLDKGPGSVYEPTLERLLARGRESRRTLRELAGKGDDHIVLVSHGGILHFITDDWHNIPDGRGMCSMLHRVFLSRRKMLIQFTATGWSNCEYRSYQFVDPTGEDEDAALCETEESWQRREGKTIPPTPTEQRELRPIALEKVAPFLNIKEVKN